MEWATRGGVNARHGGASAGMDGALDAGLSLIWCPSRTGLRRIGGEMQPVVFGIKD